MKRSKLSRLGLLFAAVLTLGVLVFAAACDDDEDDGDGGEETPAATEAEGGDDAAAAEAALQAAIDAWNAGDLETFLASFTDAGVISSFDAPREQAQVFLADFVGDPPISNGPVTTEVSGDTATIEALEFAFGAFIDPNIFTLVNQDGVWLLDNEEDVPAEIPEGTTAVDVTLLEYQFDYDASAITDGNIAFAANNIGGEEHEIALLSLDEGVDLEASLEDFATGIPEGIEVVGQAGPWPPGESANVVPREELAAGRYGMVCFIETADGTPHAALGMISEFTIE